MKVPPTFGLNNSGQPINPGAVIAWLVMAAGPQRSCWIPSQHRVIANREATFCQ